MAQPGLKPLFSKGLAFKAHRLISITFDEATSKQEEVGHRACYKGYYAKY